MKLSLKVLFAFILFLTACAKESKLNLLLQTAYEELPQNSMVYYSSFFESNSVVKTVHFKTKSEILGQKRADFFYLYHPKIEFNKATINFLQIKSGEVYILNYEYKNKQWALIRKQLMRTKVEETEGSILFNQLNH